MFKKALDFARDENGAANVDFIVLTSVVVSIALISLNAIVISANDASAAVASSILDMGEGQ